MKTLAAWLNWQEQQHPTAIDLGLERVWKVWEALGSPRPQRVVTVAGTNGKGSTVHALDALARRAGWSSGRYTSPHLYRYNERIVVNGGAVTDSVLCAAFERIEAQRGDVSLTYFEYGTLAALLILVDAQVDLAILEVGLGGRLDATNVVDADIAVLCSISRDHEDWLGSDLRGIAGEKAGIARAGKPAVIAQPDSVELYQPWLEALGADVHHAVVDEVLQRVEAHSGLPVYSLAAACHAAGLLGLPLEAKDVEPVLTALRVPGRMERRAAAFGEYLLDVAHNPASASRLATSVRQLPPMRHVLVIGMLADKDIQAVANELAALPEKVFAASLPPPRGAIGAHVAEAFSAQVPVEIHASVEEARVAAEQWAGATTDSVRIIIAGSFVTVGSCGLG